MRLPRMLAQRNDAMQLIVANRGRTGAILELAAANCRRRPENSFQLIAGMLDGNQVQAPEHLSLSSCRG